MAALHLSIVSHGQAALVGALLADLAPIASGHGMHITVTSNVPEEPPAIPGELAGVVDCVTNAEPRGFGANHNRAFSRVDAPYFCVMNPDLRIREDPFPRLLAAFADPSVGLAAPAALDPSGALQDNARALPTPLKVLARLRSAPHAPDYPIAQPAFVDLVAGFFMLFRSAVFRDLDGFDERYFLYYEDIDLCCRLRLGGRKIAWIPAARVVHDARRASHRNPRYLAWHVASVLRFFSSPVYRAARALSAPR
jgi:N-acetylglucosaminyl-diphospho-decaprenol L-rhamnosyltransferase